jgi:glutaredoxin 3
LDEHGLVYTEVDVTFDNEKRREMMERARQRTVPQIFVDGSPVGGFRELAELLKP